MFGMLEGDKKMKEYKCYQCEPDAEDTERMLNIFAMDGWKVICSYAKYWVVLERDKEICKRCGR